MRAKLRCRVSPGQFSSECAVEVQSYNGRRFSLFAGKDELTFPGTPTENESVDGWINVEILEQDRNLYLIRLPQTTLENGPFLTVRADQLDHVPMTKVVGWRPPRV
jgi:hypothetical protein